MNEYQREQHGAIRQAITFLDGLSGWRRQKIENEIRDYLDFRDETDRFLATHCGHFCTRSCFISKTSACCSKDAIVTFWADVVINAFRSNREQMSKLLTSIASPQFADKCIYLDHHGCLWEIRPLVCTMFLCQGVEQDLFKKDEAARATWRALQAKAKSYRWPDRPVLFDSLEHQCIQEGIQSPLMYLSNSPGLLRVKQLAGLK